MKNTFLISALTLLPTFSFAAPPANCAGARQATAEVKVERLHWEQVQGSYKLKVDPVCKNSLKIDVLPGRAAGCLYPILADCMITLDGSSHKITVSGEIFQNDDLGVPTKHFAASYHLDRNSGNVTTGEAGSSDVFTADLSLKNIGVAVQSKFDGPGGDTSKKPFRDGLVVTVNYGDTDAP